MVGFVGGLAEGLQGLPAEIGQLMENMRTRKAAQALMNTYSQGQQPPPQAGPVAPHPAAPLAALASQAGPPQPAGPPAMAGPPDGANASMGPPTAAPAPAAPPPGAPTGDPGAAAPTGMSVNPGLADPVKEGQSLIQNLWKSTMAANPKADPMTILKAVQIQIEDIKGVAPVTKAMMQGQLQYMNFSMKAQQFDEREARLRGEHAQKMMELAQHHANQDEIAAENARFRGEMVSIARERATYYGESVDYQHEDRQSSVSARRDIAGENNRTRRDIASESNQTRRDISEDRSDDSEYRADQGFRGAQVRSGQTPDAAPQRRAGPSKGAIPANVQAFARQHGLTVIRKRADGKYDAKAKDGTVGVIG